MCGYDSHQRTQLGLWPARNTIRGIAALQHFSRLGPQVRDDGRHPDHVGNMVDVEDEQSDARQHQDKSPCNRQTGHKRAVSNRAGDGPLYDHGVHKS